MADNIIHAYVLFYPLYYNIISLKSLKITQHSIYDLIVITLRNIKSAVIILRNIKSADQSYTEYLTSIPSKRSSKLVVSFVFPSHLTDL